MQHRLSGRKNLKFDDILFRITSQLNCVHAFSVGSTYRIEDFDRNKQSNSNWSLLVKDVAVVNVKKDVR